MKECPKCGSKYGDNNSNYCIDCGSRLFDLNSSKKPTSNIGKHKKKEDNIKLEIMQGI